MIIAKRSSGAVAAGRRRYDQRSKSHSIKAIKYNLIRESNATASKISQKRSSSAVTAHADHMSIAFLIALIEFHCDLMQSHVCNPNDFNSIYVQLSHRKQI